MKNTAIIAMITVICFLAGGGWRLKDTTFERLHDDVCHRAQGDDLTDNVFTAVMLFVNYGGAAGIAGGLATTSILFITNKRRKRTSPNQTP